MRQLDFRSWRTAVQTIKTAIVVVLLLFVIYGGYIALNGTDTPLRDELQELVKADETMPDVSTPSGPLTPPGASAFTAFNSAPPPSFGPTTAPSASPDSAPTSPFASAFSNNGAASSAPPSLPAATVPNADSNSTSSQLQPSPLLLPTTPSSPNSTSGSPTVPTQLPPPPNTGDVSAKSDKAKLESDLVASVPVSTSTPGFGLAVPATKVPADLTSGSTAFPSPKSSSPTSLPALDLPTVHGGASNLAEATAPKAPGDDEVANALSEDKATPPIKPSSAPGRSFQNAKELALEQINRGNLKEGLTTLSVFYNAPELTSEQREDLLDILDALAREVVFSRAHLLELPYIVAPGETLETIAKQYQTPPEIIARINAIDPSSPLPGGAKLKVLTGPFRGEVDLNRNELTLFLGELYAARFPISVGNDPAPKAGPFQVIDKQRDRNYYGKGGLQIQKGDPRNPYGGYWIDLGQDICIHGSPAAETSSSPMGCISLSPADAADVFGMLSRGSQITIRR